MGLQPQPNTTTTTMMTTALDSLKQYTTVVSDTGDFEGLEAYKPQDGTTNPSLILAAVKDPKYGRLIDVAVKYAKEKGGDEDAQVDACLDRLLVEFGKEILAIVPGRVSTGVDARFSFDKTATLAKARHLIELYESIGISKDRILIKIASFRNTDEIEELAGCDFLTISPSLLEKLHKSDKKLERKLSPEQATGSAEKIPKASFVDNEPEFRWALLEDQMAFDKLHEGISKFAADAVTLKDILKERLAK